MKKDFKQTALLTLIFLGLGFTLLEFDLVGFGISFFVFLPFILGYLLGGKKVKSFSFAGLVFSLVIFCICLLAGELEGMVCILMAMPIVLFFIAVGYVIKFLFKALFNSFSKGENPDDDLLDDNLLKSSIFPLCLFMVFGIAEKQLTHKEKEIVEVSTEIILPYSPLEVYETIKSVDTLDVEKTFLMKLDLPVPQKCILEEEKVGGLRTCYFKGGTIVERVTEMEKGKILRMDVIDYQLTGRVWMGFKEAIYTFEELENGHCKMTRITTYTSELYPRIYWEPLERTGIEQEHDYVFRNLRKDLTLVESSK